MPSKDKALVKADAEQPDEVEEGDYHELSDQERALVVVGGAEVAGTFALAVLTDEQFDARLKAMSVGRRRVRQIQKALMREGVDYGVIPGTKKPSLLKPGAETLADAYQLRAAFHTERVLGDGKETPALRYLTRCDLHLGSLEGPIVAQGHGAANSHERHYRWRTGSLACPNCGSSALLKSKHDPEYFCWSKKGGCGKKFPLDDPRITGQTVGDVENTDPHDLENTLLKMSEKRAHVDAVIRALAISGLFTQDVEDDLPPPITDGSQPASAPALVGNADPTEAGQEESAVSGSGTFAADSPPPPDEGPDAYEGSVITPLPDRVREVKRPEWLHTLPPEATVAKTELKMTVGRSKHTAILLGDWAYAVQAANLTEGDTVRVRGKRVEVVWQEGMPTKKEIRFVTRVEVLRDGGWQLLTSPQEALFTEKAADVAATIEKVTDVADGDFREAAEEIFAGDVKPPTVEQLLTLPPAKGEQDEPFDATLMLLTLEAKTAGSGREYVQVKATDKENVYSGIMEKAEADAQLGPGLDNYAQGEVVRLIGTWVVTVKGPVILLTAVTGG